MNPLKRAEVLGPTLSRKSQNYAFPFFFFLIFPFFMFVQCTDFLKFLFIINFLCACTELL